MAIINWRPKSLFPTMDRWTEGFFDDDFFAPRTINVPAVNVKETDEEYHLEFAVPGMKKDDFTIEVKNGILTVSSEKEVQKEEKDDGYTRKEFSYEAFNRSFYLPETVNADKITAVYKEGVLEVKVPKLVKSKAIPVRTITVK